MSLLWRYYMAVLPILIFGRRLSPPSYSTPVIPRLLEMFTRMQPKHVLASSTSEYLAEMTRQQVAGR